MHPPLTETNVHLVDSVENAMAFKRWLGERRFVLAVDTETGGLEPWKQPLRLVQFGDAMTGWAIPWEGWGGVALEALREYEGDLAGHNLKFDANFVESHSKFKWPWGRSHDTMVQAHIIDSTQAVGLKPLANRLVDRRASWGQERLHEAMKKQGWGWADIPVEFDYYWFYGGLDAILTARVAEIQAPLVAPYRDVYDVEMQIMPIIMRMEQHGMRIDIEYTRRKLDELRQYVSESRAWAQQNYGASFNMGSNKQLAEALKRDGVSFSKLTPTGQAALDEEVLSAIDHPLARTALQSRKAEKLASTYFESFLEQRDGDRLHCNVRTLGARTGRMSITDPPLQTLPRGPVVRNAFIADEGHSIITADYDQIEMRLMAHFSQDRGLVDAFHAPEDFFVSLARLVWSDDTIIKKDPRRAVVKGVAYGKAYGAGTETMAHTAGIPVEEMQVVHDEFNRRFPGVLGFQRAVEQVSGQRAFTEGAGYVTTPLGRKLVCDQGKNYTLTNYLIQSHAGEILKQALIRLDNADLGEYMLLPVHDEVVFSVPQDQVVDVIPVIKEAMQDLEHYAVPITCGADGPYERWGDKWL